MTVEVLEPDMRGVDALSGKLDDDVAAPPLLIWNELVAELGELPEVPVIEPFDEQPWQQLPTMEQMEHLWASSPPLESMIHRLAAVASDGKFDDLPRYIAAQRALADMELDLKRQREALDAEEFRTTHVGRSAKAAGVASAAARRGRGDLPGGSEDGDKVGGSAETGKHPNVGKASKVSGRRRSGQA